MVSGRLFENKYDSPHICSVYVVFTVTTGSHSSKPSPEKEKYDFFFILLFFTKTSLCSRGCIHKNILRLKVAPNLLIHEKLLKLMGVSVLILELLHFWSKSISQSVLALKLLNLWKVRGSQEDS